MLGDKKKRYGKELLVQFEGIKMRQSDAELIKKIRLLNPLDREERIWRYRGIEVR